MSRDAWRFVIEGMKADFEAPVASETCFDGIMKVSGPDLENAEYIIDNANLGNLT